MNRLADLTRFYEILGSLEERTGGKRTLSEYEGRRACPPRGVYFFFEADESRSDTGYGARVTRVGTHALKTGSKSSLWKRLSQHSGTKGTGGGNHRGSIFRLLVGVALKRRDQLEGARSWDLGNNAGAAAKHYNMTGAEVLRDEHDLEVAVSSYIRKMPFIWIGIDDDAGPASARGSIERNSIGLLSNFEVSPLDPQSNQWLGAHCDRDRVCRSGLWNNNHVDEGYDPLFLDLLSRHA